MRIRPASFNIYLLILLILIPAGSGCKTSRAKKDSKEIATLRFHLEVNPDGTPHNTGVRIFRASPVVVNVHREPVLSEADIEQAALVDAIGGFAIRIQFNRHGAIVLENITTIHRGRRLAIHSQFQFGESRWLAAPLIQRRIVNGLFVFTPDATREEAERIVKGLNIVAARL
jgi:hypothetical protein